VENRRRGQMKKSRLNPPASAPKSRVFQRNPMSSYDPSCPTPFCPMSSYDPSCPPAGRQIRSRAAPGYFAGCLEAGLILPPPPPHVNRQKTPYVVGRTLTIREWRTVRMWSVTPSFPRRTTSDLFAPVPTPPHS
jgi:hypothetical protein